MALVLTACGGGGESTAPPPTQLPVTLSVSAPATRQSVGGAIEFASNAQASLTHQWDFGDGASSTSSEPSHTYAKPGVYTVHVTVTNEAGSKAEASFVVAVSDTSIVSGRVCTGSDGSGWCWQRPLPQGNSIADATYLDDKHGWAVGDKGTILATSDGGATWSVQRSGTGLPLNTVSFVDSKIGWIGGNNGTALRTTDGGASWTEVSTGLSEQLMSINAIDQNTAWTTTYSATLLITTDAGAHWKAVTNPGVPRMFATSSTDFWTIPYTYWGQPLALGHSTDGGTTWTQVPVPASSESNLSRSIQDARFFDANHGWLVMYESGYLASTGSYVYRQAGYRTSDGGATWQSFDIDPFKSNTDPSYYYYSPTFQFIDANTVLARSGYNGTYMRSIDGAATWTPVPLPDASGWSLKATSGKTMVAQSYYGTSHVTFDAGAHWDKRSEDTKPSLNSVWFFNSREGMAMSDNGGTVRTTDGGVTWTSTEPSSYYPGWRRMQFLADASVGWVISDSGTIYRSTDKGRSWLSPVPQTSASMSYLSDFHFIDATNGWAVSSSGAFYRSIDGGGTWQVANGPTIGAGYLSLRFADTTHGVAVGPAGVAATTLDGGTNWQPRPTNTDQTLVRVTFIDANTAIAVGTGGAIVRSKDKGQTWTRIASPVADTLNDVRFIDAKVGVAVGVNGTVLMSRDGGLTWALQSTGARASLASVFFLDDQTGWVVGYNGTILVTATGGQ